MSALPNDVQGRATKIILGISEICLPKLPRKFQLSTFSQP
jgi:hypothetical protein